MTWQLSLFSHPKWFSSEPGLEVSRSKAAVAVKVIIAANILSFTLTQPTGGEKYHRLGRKPPNNFQTLGAPNILLGM